MKQVMAALLQVSTVPLEDYHPLRCECIDSYEGKSEKYTEMPYCYKLFLCLSR